MTSMGDISAPPQRPRALLEDTDAPAFERHADGVWRYAGTDIPVVAAVDRTLAEEVIVRQVARGDEPPEAVLISTAEIDANPGLEWVRTRGRRLRSDAGDEYLVPWEVWQEHASTPVGVRAPERDGSGIVRLAAIEERELRYARHEAELRAARRTRLVAIMTGIGMTRREVGECVGLSTGRVQQVVEDLPPAVQTDVDELLRDALHVLRQIGPRTVDRDEVELPREREVELLDELVAYGLLEQTRSAVRLTEAGERAELHLRTKRKS